MPKTPKRNIAEEEDKRRRKIRRLERKLAKYRSESDDLSEDDVPVEALVEVVDEPPQPPADVEDIENIEIEEIPTQPEEHIEIEPEPIEGVPESENALAEPELELPLDILEALGEDCGLPKEYGPEIHKDIYRKIENILLQGLPKEHRDELMKTMMIPANAKLLDAPKLNAELGALLNMNTKNRDKLLQGRQQDLGLAIASISYSVDKLSKKEFNKVNIVKYLGEASRLLSNLHNEYTQMRKKLISPHIDKSLSLNLKDNVRSEFLYNKLEDTVKTMSIMKRTTNILKPRTKNYYHPPRRAYPAPQIRAPARGGYQPGYQPRFQPGPPARPPPRAPARRPPPPAAQAPARGRARYP